MEALGKSIKFTPGLIRHVATPISAKTLKESL
jgi:hypothetical protein